MWSTLITLWLALSGHAPQRRAPHRRPAFRRPFARRPWLETLEDRTAPAVLTVNTVADNTTDTSVLTLRDAITLVNNGGDPSSLGQSSMPAGWQTQINTTSPFGTNDTIAFHIASSGMQTIYVSAPLPTITNPVVIDGTTEPGWRANSLPLTGSTAGDNAVWTITLDGSQSASNGDGLAIAAAGSTVQGLVIENFAADGIELAGRGDMVVGNFIGTNGGDGITLNAANITIGGTAAVARNIISGNSQNGVLLFNDDVVEGNYIGTDVTGTTALGNGQNGILANSFNTIGGTATGAGNVISANTGTGLSIDADNLVEGNYIGTDSSGTAALGNAAGGVYFIGPSNIIGGSMAGAGNLISANSVFAIDSDRVAPGNVIQGNFVDTDITGTVALNPANSSGLALGAINILVGGPSPTAAGGIPAGVGSLPGESGAFVGNLIDAPVEFQGANSVLQGNYIGTNVTGALPLGLTFGSAFGVGDFGTDSQIGGTDPGTGNVISGVYSVVNAYGLGLFGTGASVQGNYIGTDVTGTAALGNTIDILITGSSNTVGGTTPAARNLIAGGGYDNLGDPQGISGSGRGGVLIAGGTGNVLEGNFLGTNAAGTASVGQTTGNVDLFQGASGNTIGGTIPGAGNVISGKGGEGVQITDSGTSGNLVAGNFIGTDVSGTVALGNSGGVFVGSGVTGNTIGGLTAAARNIISGNAGDGLLLGGAGTSVEGNYIGTDVTGTLPLGNAGGIAVQGGISNTIGATTPGAGNVIADNSTFGVLVTGNGATGNSIRGNSIYNNGTIGLGLGGTTFFANDSQGHTGPNLFQDYPELQTVTITAGGELMVTYSVPSADTSATYPLAVDFYLPDKNGQGETYVASAMDPAAGAAVADLGNAAALGVTVGESLVATATDAAGNTSEFSPEITFATPLTVVTYSSVMLVGNNPPPLTGSVNGTPFTSPFMYTTPSGDIITIALNTAATSASPVGMYSIGASLSGTNSGNYALNVTAGTMYVVSVGPDPSSTTGAQAVTFWDNKGNAKLITAADLSSLDILNLVNQGGSAFDPKSVAQLQAWLSVSPNATAAYQLAVQLAAMDLNVLAGDVKTTDLVFAGGLLPYATADNITGLTSGGFIDVQALMNAANTALGQVSPGAPAHDPNTAYELALASVLQAANGNGTFVSQELLWGLVGLYPSLPPA